MTPGPIDLAQVRLDNALLLFEEFVRHTARHADAATLRGLERRFAERLQIQPSYWSQIKNRSRQIGERLARQFEHLCHKPRGWMDVAHDAKTPADAFAGAGESDASRLAGAAAAPARESEPQDDDERFIVGLVLTYYRRHPQRARTRLLDLLGEVLIPTAQPARDGVPAAVGGVPAVAVVCHLAGLAGRPPRGYEQSGKATSAHEGSDLWRKSSAGIAPLKHRK